MLNFYVLLTSLMKECTGFTKLTISINPEEFTYLRMSELTNWFLAVGYPTDFLYMSVSTVDPELIIASLGVLAN